MNSPAASSSLPRILLGSLIGAEKAIVAGFVPFILGSVLKTALAAGTVKAIPARFRAWHRG